MLSYQVFNLLSMRARDKEKFGGETDSEMM